MSEQLKDYVLLKGGTEPAFSGRYCDHKGDGVYRCAGCGAVLFDSSHKYDSGSGWPSFTSPASEQALQTRADYSHNMQRIEVRCAACAGHLGHVFPDGPRDSDNPKGLRYCINSAALDFSDRTDSTDSTDATDTEDS